jgi:hypothetical protein
VIIPPVERPASPPPAQVPASPNLPAASGTAGEAEEPAAPVKKPEPKIFVPDRPPDDPGPVPADLDETSTPYSRFRGSMRQQVS